MRTRVTVPDLGDFKDVAVIEVQAKVGENVAVDQALVTLESEKATMDIPSTVAGRIAAVLVTKGDKVSTGTPVADVESEGEVASPPAAAPSAPVAASAAPAAISPAAPAAAPARDAAPVEVKIPDLGDFHDVEVIEVVVKVGDVVAADASLITLESEKATMDVPTPVAGRVQSLKVGKGARVNSGDAIAVIVPAAPAAPAAPGAPAAPARAAPSEATDATVRHPALSAAALRALAAERTPPRPPPAPATAASAPAPIPPGEPGSARAYAGPSVRQLARELGVDLGQVRGSGPKGRITHEDVKAYVKAALTGGRGSTQAPAAAAPRVAAVDFSKFGPVAVEPLNRIQRIAAPRLQASWATVPHVTQFDIADITDLEASREQLKQKAAKDGVRLTPLAFVLRAVVRTLAQFPHFASSLDASGENLVLKKYLHLGFAADTPNGLVVPVIRDADRKDVYELARSLAALSEKARAGKLTPGEMQGGCFTVSSLGGIGGTAFTPIVNAPEVAILGVSRSTQQPVWRDGQFVPRLMLPLSLSYDHRVIDGAAAVRFTTALVAQLGDARGLLEAVP
jgi:pyruvate dehydrogenase E2 component (dihydrolipoamide acetyltransferase)